MFDPQKALNKCQNSKLGQNGERSRQKKGAVQFICEGISDTISSRKPT